jgi:hypothetical protein
MFNIKNKIIIVVIAIITITYCCVKLLILPSDYKKFTWVDDMIILSLLISAFGIIRRR